MLENRPGLKPPLQNSASPKDGEPEDINKILKWQEERIEKKLRGEHESAVLHLSEVVSTTSGSYLFAEADYCTG